MMLILAGEPFRIRTRTYTTPIIAAKRNKNSAFHQSKSNTEKEGRKLS